MAVSLVIMAAGLGSRYGGSKQVDGIGPHNEILIASLMAYRDTKDEKYLEWFFKTAEYCKTCFADDVCGEWYGYLRRDGKPTEPPCKGSTFKGPFHVPRSLIMADVLLGDILEG